MREANKQATRGTHTVFMLLRLYDKHKNNDDWVTPESNVLQYVMQSKKDYSKRLAG